MVRVINKSSIKEAMKPLADSRPHDTSSRPLCDNTVRCVSRGVVVNRSRELGVALWLQKKSARTRALRHILPDVPNTVAFSIVSFRHDCCNSLLAALLGVALTNTEQLSLCTRCMITGTACR